MGFVFRGRDRAMQVARTIADLRNPDGVVEVADVLEALSYRQELVLGGGIFNKALRS